MNAVHPIASQTTNTIQKKGVLTSSKRWIEIYQNMFRCSDEKEADLRRALSYSMKILKKNQNSNSIN